MVILYFLDLIDDIFKEKNLSLLLYLFLYICTDSWIPILLLIVILFILMFKLSLNWPVGAPSGWFLCSFDLSLSYLYLHILWYKKIFQAPLVFYLPQSYCQPLFQSVLIPFRGEWYLETKIKVCGVLTTTGLSLLLGFLSREN